MRLFPDTLRGSRGKARGVPGAVLRAGHLPSGLFVTGLSLCGGGPIAPFSQGSPH